MNDTSRKLLVKAERGMALKPLQMLGVALVISALMGVLGDYWASSLIILGVALILVVARMLLWSWMGNLYSTNSHLMYQPHRGEELHVPWDDVERIELTPGSRWPQWEINNRHSSPLPELHIWLKKDRTHPLRPGCDQTPGLAGAGYHTPDHTGPSWQLPLLTKAQHQAEAQLREVALQHDIKFQGTTPTPTKALPWEETRVDTPS